MLYNDLKKQKRNFLCCMTIMTNIEKLITETDCENILIKLMENPDTNNRLLQTNITNSLYRVTVKDEQMIMKISTNIDIELENNKKLELELFFPTLYKSLIYENKLFSFYEKYDGPLSFLFRGRRIGKKLGKSIMEQLEMFTTIYYNVFNVYPMCNISNFLFKCTDEKYITYNKKKIYLHGFQIKLFDYEISLLETKSPIKIIDYFFLDNISKYVSHLAILKFKDDNQKSILANMRNKNIDNVYNRQYTDEWDLLVESFIEWLLREDLLYEFIIYANKKPINFPYIYPDI